MNNLDEMKKLVLLCEDNKADRGEGDMSTSIYGGSSTKKEKSEDAPEDKNDKKSSKKEIVDEEPAADSTSSFKKDSGKPFKVATNPGVKDENATKVKQLADAMFGHKPYSQARIGPTKDIRRYSYLIYDKGLGKGADLTKPEVKEKLRDIRLKFLNACKKQGIKEGSVDVKFHNGSGVYASVQIQLPTDAKAPEKKTKSKIDPSAVSYEDKVKALYKKAFNGKITHDEFAKAIKALHPMKEDAAGVGIITKQNTTPDVKPGETGRQAKKFGNNLEKIAKVNGKI
jgi:hypothetical protein